jgi:hypothetical protein
MTRHTHLVIPVVVVVMATAGCQFDYPWDSGPPVDQELTNDLTCGIELEGAMEWYVLDGETYPEAWDEICSIQWTLTGVLTTAFDHDACDNCRCVYDVVGTISAESCGWYDLGSQDEFQLGFLPTSSGPSDYQEYAGDWPWIVYSSYTPSWNSLEFTYLAQEDDTALPASYDGHEFYLYSYWSWILSESEDRMKLSAWIGTWD